MGKGKADEILTDLIFLILEYGFGECSECVDGQICESEWCLVVNAARKLCLERDAD
jgi:hypothetical protein